MKTNIIYQNYGTSILLFIKGETEQDAYDKWLSLFNWGATSTEVNNVAPCVVSCWSTIEKFKRYLFNIHEARLLNNRPTNMTDDELVKLATQRADNEFEAFATEKHRSVNNDSDPYEMGVLVAEKPDDDWGNCESLGAAAMEKVWG
jgi:hypothetical protein